MKTLKSLWLIPALAFMLAVVACQKSDLVQPGNDTSSDETLSLDKEYGGFTTSDELPGFGDTNILTDFSEDEPVTDQAVADAEAILTSDQVPAYFVRITWGHLEFDSTATEVVDWSGFAEVNKGTLGVLKLIRFEHATDHLNLPRESRTRVDFTSQTTVHYDGLLFVIIDNDTAATDVQGEFTFQAGAYSRTFTFAELDSMDLLEPVDENGNEVSIISHSKLIQPFAGGFFSGRWVRINDRRGHFEGRWIDSMGNNTGFLKGIWGQNGRGLKVLFGKYIKQDGEFGGLLAGQWGYKGLGQKHGWLAGYWINRNHDQVGKFHGVWKSGRPGDGRGYFHGRWTERQDNGSTD